MVPTRMWGCSQSSFGVFCIPLDNEKGTKMSDRDDLISENRKLREDLKWAETGAFMILAVCLIFMNTGRDHTAVLLRGSGFWKRQQSGA